MCLISMLIANKVVFMHQHILPNGKIIFHAHPYHKSNTEEPGKTHSHSEVEFLFIENLELLFLFVFNGILVITIRALIFFILESGNSLIEKYINFFQGRAPPVLQS